MCIIGITFIIPCNALILFSGEELVIQDGFIPNEGQCSTEITISSTRLEFYIMRNTSFQMQVMTKICQSVTAVINSYEAKCHFTRHHRQMGCIIYEPSQFVMSLTKVNNFVAILLS